MRTLPLACFESIHRVAGWGVHKGSGWIPQRAGLTAHELYVQGFLPKQMLVALSEDQVSGPSSQAEGACKQAEL